MTTLGNIELLNTPAIGFLCSRKFASKAILTGLEWAMEKAKDESVCVMSTFHSPIEKEALGFLLRGKCKIIVVLGRRMYRKVPEELQSALDEGRLLLISLSERIMINASSAWECNQYIAENASSLVFAFISEKSRLEKLRENAMKRGLQCEVLSVIETHNPDLK